MYPQKSLFSEIIGYDSYHLRIDAGIEAPYNSYLAPHAQKASTLCQLLSPPPPTTDNVTLTVDPTLQQAAQTALAIPDAKQGRGGRRHRPVHRGDAGDVLEPEL